VRNLLRNIASFAKANTLTNIEEISQQQQFKILQWTKPSEQLPYTSQSAFWSGALSGLRQVLLMILLISGLDVALAQGPQIDKEFVTGRLLNWTLSDSCIRMKLDVGIAYGSDAKKAITILGDIIKNHELVVDDPAPDVIFNKFDNSALNLTVRYFSTDVQKRFYLLSDLHVKINEAFKEAGITIAFPQIDVHFDKEDKTKIIPGEAPATS